MSTVHLPRRSSSRTLKTSNSQLAYLLSEDVTSSIRKILAARGILLFESSDRADLASGLRVYFSKGWVPFDPKVHTQWHLQWRTARYAKNEYIDLLPSQRLNHFHGTSGITKKVTPVTL